VACEAERTLHKLHSLPQNDLYLVGATVGRISGAARSGSAGRLLLTTNDQRSGAIINGYAKLNRTNATATARCGDIAGATVSQLLLFLSALPPAVSCAPIGCEVAATTATMPNTPSTVRMSQFLGFC
jgi:hypothetical protein